MLTAPPIDSATTGVVRIELGAPIPDIDDVPDLGARCLIQLDGRIITTVDLEPGTRSYSSEELTARIAPAVVDALSRVAPERRPTGWRELTPAGLGPRGVTPSTATRNLTVVIATRDRPESLLRCLMSVQATVPPPKAVVVVDNAPSDRRTEEMLAETPGLESVRYVLEPRRGLGRAHNAALSLIDTEFVAFTDDDVVVDPTWVGSLADAFEAGDDVVCVTGLIAPLELRTREQWWMERSCGFAKGYERRIHSLGGQGSSTLFPYDAGTFGSGANMAFRTSYLREVGGFDRSLGTGTRALGGDDLAALHGVVARGHQLVYEPAAVVLHRHHDALAALERQAYGYGAGLTAYLASVIAARPLAIVAIVRRVGAGARQLGSSRSPMNARRPGDYPARLVRRERLGMIAGPARYAWQRWVDRGENGVPAVTAPGRNR